MPLYRYYEISYHNFNFIMIWPEKPIVFEDCSWFKFNNLGLPLGVDFKFFTSVEKKLKLKVEKFFGLISAFLEVIWVKLVGGIFAPSPILNRVKVKQAKEARVNQFLLQNVQNNEIFEISKMFKSNCWIKINYTKRL